MLASRFVGTSDTSMSSKCATQALSDVSLLSPSGATLPPPLSSTLAVVLRGDTRWQVEEHLRQIVRPREHRVVPGAQLDEPPGRASHLAEHGVATGDDRPYLFEREATHDTQLRQRFPGGVLQPQRLRKGPERLVHGPGAQQF